MLHIKVWRCCMVLVCCLGLLAPGCDKLGGSRPEKVSGTVISVDEAKKEIVIKDAQTGKERTLTAENPGQLALLKPGMVIKAKVKRGTNVAERLSPPRVQKDSAKSGGKQAAE